MLRAAAACTSSQSFTSSAPGMTVLQFAAVLCTAAIFDAFATGLTCHFTKPIDPPGARHFASLHIQVLTSPGSACCNNVGSLTPLTSALEVLTTLPRLLESATLRFWRFQLLSILKLILKIGNHGGTFALNRYPRLTGTLLPNKWCKIPGMVYPKNGNPSLQPKKGPQTANHPTLSIEYANVLGGWGLPAKNFVVFGS